MATIPQREPPTMPGKGDDILETVEPVTPDKGEEVKSEKVPIVAFSEHVEEHAPPTD